MKELTLTEAFASYGAKLKNTRWACSAIASDGALVISCWDHFLKSHVDGHKRYEDHLAGWRGNHHGRNLLGEHLKIAVEGDRPVRLVVAKVDDESESVYGDASSLPKTFSIEKNLVGKVVEFDGDGFVIEFRA